MTGAIRRLDLGYFIRPASETGGPEPRVEPVLAYLVVRDDGVILFDTGCGDAGPEAEAHYRPRRRSLPDALAACGLTPRDVSLIVNCHLHFDHSGGNPLFPRIPIVVQKTELELARSAGYTVPELVDFPASPTASSWGKPRSGLACGSFPPRDTPTGTSPLSYASPTAPSSWPDRLMTSRRPSDQSSSPTGRPRSRSSRRCRAIGRG